jgi:hypothetical protein
MLGNIDVVLLSGLSVEPELEYAENRSLNPATRIIFSELSKLHFVINLQRPQGSEQYGMSQKSPAYAVKSA